MKHRYLVLLGIFAIGISACNKQTIQPAATDLGWDFQPLNKGHFVIYDVDSIIYDDFNKRVDTFRLEMKDEIGNTFIDDEGRESHYVNRAVRYNPQDPWVTSHVFYITQDNYKLEWKENNLRFIKMVFPVKLNKKWLGNAYIATQTNTELRWMDEWSYRYTDVLVNYNTGSKTYANTHIIDQINNVLNDTSSTTSYNALTFSKEVFAQDVGLVYREITNWEFQENGSKYRSGFTTIMRAKANN